MSFATDPWAALDATLAHVAEDSFFAVAEPAPQGWRGLIDPGTAWIEARLGFNGAAGGVLICRIPQSLARDLASAFVGLPPDAVDEAAVRDMAGELANMLGGSWLTRAFPTALVDLEQPRVATCVDPPDAGWHLALLNGVPVGVTLSAAGEAGEPF